MSGSVVILGGRQFRVEPLRLGQLRALLDALDDLSGKTGGAVVDAAARVIHAGLSRATPELTLDGVLELETTMDEVTAAVAAILQVAGLSAAGETRSGEAAPVASRRTMVAPE
jgi:hypothetical protein